MYAPQFEKMRIVYMTFVSVHYKVHVVNVLWQMCVQMQIQKKFKSKSLIKIVIFGIIPSMGNIAYRFLGLSS